MNLGHDVPMEALEDNVAFMFDLVKKATDEQRRCEAGAWTGKEGNKRWNGMAL